MKPLLSNELQPRSPIFFPLPDGPFQGFHILRRIAHQHLTAADELKIQFLGQLFHESIAFHTESGLQ